jgi:hypothetical protein
MLSQISWQHYLAAISITTGSYYLYIFLRYYQKEIARLFNRYPDHPSIIPDVESEPYSIMGAAKSAPTIISSEPEALLFADQQEDEGPIAPVENNRLPQQELLQEVDRLVAGFKTTDDKPEFLNLLQVLIGSYQSSREEIDLAEILDNIQERSAKKLPFSLTKTDLEIRWTDH